MVTSPIFLHFCIDSDCSWGSVKSTERTSSCFSTSMFFHVTFRYYLRFLVDWNQCLDFLSPAVWSWPQWRWKGWGFCLFVFCLAFFWFFVAFFFDDTYFYEVIFLWEKKKEYICCLFGVPWANLSWNFLAYHHQSWAEFTVNRACALQRFLIRWKLVQECLTVLKCKVLFCWF